MTQPRILLATLVLNETEWLQKLYLQHKDWPGLVSWVFVEGADAAYARANPELIANPKTIWSPYAKPTAGLSVDGTTEFLWRLAAEDGRVVHVPYGLTSEKHLIDQGKAELRNEYLKVANLVKPDYVIVLDADEMYTYGHQYAINDYLVQAPKRATGMCFRQREVWRPPSIVDQPLLSWEVIGGLWKMTHCHCWRWFPGMKYEKTHIWPEMENGVLMNRDMYRCDHVPLTPEYVHLGWASQARTRLAKIAYYKERGEGVGDSRAKWMECRHAWANWKPGDVLPHGARVIHYRGPVPEALIEEVK